MYKRQKTRIFGIDTRTKPIVTPVGVHGGINPGSCTCSISTHRRNLTVVTRYKTSTIPKTCMTTLKAPDSSVTSIQKEIQMDAGVFNWLAVWMQTGVNNFLPINVSWWETSVLSPDLEESVCMNMCNEQTMTVWKTENG